MFQVSSYSHDGLVRLILKVHVPESIELGAHLFELFLSRANLNPVINSFSPPDRTQLITNLEPGIDGVGGQARLLRAYLPLGEELEAELVSVAKVDGRSHYLLLGFFVTAQEVVKSDALIGDTVNCWYYQCTRRVQ